MATPVLTPAEERQFRQRIGVVLRFADGPSKSTKSTVSSILAVVNNILADRK